jgi:signal transduction histidine kinase
MTSATQYIQTQLDDEFLRRSKASSLSMMICLVLLMIFSNYELIPSDFPSLLLLINFVLSFLRFKISSSKKFTMRVNKLFVFLTAICWSLIFVFLFFSFKNNIQGQFFVVFMTLGFGLASISSVSIDKTLHLLFNLILTLPLIVFLFLMFGIDSLFPLGYYLFFLVLQFIYVHIQGTKNRENIAKIYLQSWENIQAKEEILKAHEALEQQRVIVEHSARLASLGELAANIGHEIANPLSSLSMLIQVLKIKKPLIDDQTQRLIVNCDKSILKISKIVKGLRGLSSQEHQVDKINVADFLNDCVLLYEEKARFLQCDLIKVYSDDVSDIKIKVNALQQIMIVLIQNAFDEIESFSHTTKPWIKISLSTIKDKEERVLLQIDNSGAPIPLDFKERLFKPFFSTKNQQTRSGVSLYMAHHHALEIGCILEYDWNSPFPSFRLHIPVIK